MKYQHYPTEALPFPLEIQLDIVIIEGLKTHLVQRHTETPGTRNNTTREAQNKPIYQQNSRTRAGYDVIGRGQRQRGRCRGRGCTHGYMDESRAMRALINAFETETQYSEPMRTFP
jgi:hypothetical protein